MKLEIETADSPAPLYLKLQWISGKGEDGLEFDLYCGAGVGSPYLSLNVEMPDGSVIRDYVDIRKFVAHWVDGLVKHGAREDG